MNGCLSDYGNGNRAMHRIAIRDGVDELGLAMHQRERDVVRGQNLVVVQTARELPGLLVESMSHVPEPWVVDDFCQVDHRKVDSPLGDECHAPSWVEFGLNLTCEGLVADPPRFEHGFPAPEARVISRLHYGSRKESKSRD